MIEFQDSEGRLIVVFPAGRHQYCVYVDGKCAALYRSGQEAVEHAKSLVAEQSAEPTTSSKIFLYKVLPE
jgi:hypothetical protein